MTSSPRPRIIVHHRVPRVQPPAEGIVAVAVDGAAPTDCGWYESSFALRQGLAVSELADDDGSAVAQWFAALRAADGRDVWAAAARQ